MFISILVSKNRPGDNALSKSKYIWDMIPGNTANEWGSRRRGEGSQKAREDDSEHPGLSLSWEASDTLWTHVRTVSQKAGSLPKF